VEKALTLKIEPKYERLLPSLPKEEYDLLKESIKEVGLLSPIVINVEGIILDGRNRYKICLELGIKPKTEIKTFSNLLEEKRFVIIANLRRRHLEKFQRAELGYSLLEIERELAKQRMSEAGKIGRNIQLGVSSNEPPPSEGRARDVVAKQVMLSPTTFQRAIVIIEKAPEQLKEKLRHGEKSIANAYNELKKVEDKPRLLEDGFFPPATPYGDGMYRISSKYQTSRKDGFFIIKGEEAYPTLKCRSWFFHEDLREFSLREYANVQCFPSDFRFVGVVDEIKNQIGNAVPPPMAKHIASLLPPSNALDLFSGAGGMSLGFRQANHKIVLAIEWDRACCYTYHLNFPEVPIISRDMREVSQDDLTRQIGKTPIELVFGGPPCQGFSFAGKRFKDDERNELYKEFIRILGYVKPNFFVMENVLGILEFKEQIIEDFGELGFKVSLEVVHGENLGMRQKRSRVFFVGSKAN